MCHIIVMPSVNMRQLRDTKRLKAWLRAGKTIELCDRNKRIARLEDHQRTGRWIVLPMPELAFDLCADLARRYGPKLGVRTLDSLHVACALELKAERFWTFDERQAKLAKAEGLKS